MSKVRTLRAAYSLAGLLCAVVGASGERPAAAQTAPSLRLRLTLPRQNYLQEEEITPRITLTNARSGAGEVRLPQPLHSVALEVVDAAGKPLVSQIVCSFGPGLGLILTLRKATKSAAPAKALPVRTQSPGALIIPASFLPLRSGESVETDFEIIEGVYGVVPVGRYRIRAVYAGEKPTATSPWVPFVVRPLTEREEQAKQAYTEMRNTSRENTIELGKKALAQFPDSIFAGRVRREMLLSAVHLKDWPTVVEVGRQVAAEPLWHGQHRVSATYYAQGLWYTGKRAEAEAVLLSIERGGLYLDKLRRRGD